MNIPARTFEARPAVREDEPLLIGIIGPPGGGKSLSGLKLARGIQSIRGGDIIVLDTEGGRSRKYSDLVKFLCCELTAFDSETMLEAIRAQLPRNPAAIMVDSFSDEHERYLEWHDEMVPRMGGNEWAAWAKPKAARKKLISGILRIKTPLIFTFRAREKTAQNPNSRSAKDKIINIGWQPIAPLEIVHTLDLTCILPPRADGVPVWKSDKIGEDFIIKLPNYLQPYITEGQALSEEMGAGFARWAAGSTETTSPQRNPAPVSHAAEPEPAAPSAPVPTPASGAAGASSDRIAEMVAAETTLRNAAEGGTAELQHEWFRLPRWMRSDASMVAAKEKLKARAADIDAEREE